MISVLLVSSSPFGVPILLIVLMVIAVFAAIINWAATTGKLGIVISRIRAGRGANDISNSDYLPENDLISRFFDYNDTSYPIITIEKTKDYDKEIGDAIYRISYSDNGVAKNVDVSESRMEMPITVENLSSQSLTIRYRGDISATKSEHTIQVLRDKIDQLKAEMLALRDKLREEGFSPDYKAARAKQREGAIHSSRTFGGFGTRYGNGEEMPDSEDGDE